MVSGTDDPGWVFIREWGRLHAENCVLKKVVINQWHTYKYNEGYISYLCGGQDEETFRAIARQHAVTFQSMDEQQLAFACHVVLKTLDEMLTSGDLSNLLNLNPADIDQNRLMIDYFATCTETS